MEMTDRGDGTKRAAAHQPLRVGVLFGGRSGEHEISVASATSVIATLEKHRERYEVVPIGITKEGLWLPEAESRQALARGQVTPSSSRDPSPTMNPLPRGFPETTFALHPETLDVVFPLLHGPYGEDGTVQGLLELLNIPYVGAGVLASALGMDKAAMKTLFRQQGLPVVDFLLILRRQWTTVPDRVIREVEDTLGYPCFVKPANLGSSVGISKASSRSDLCAALPLAGRYDRRLLVERAIVGREIEVGILGNDDPEASVPAEIVPHKDWYDYEAKYQEGMTEIRIPAPLPPAIAEEFRRMAREAFLAIDGAGMARVDFFLERATEKIYVNEINTIPGFTATSVYPRLWEKSGIEFSTLVDRLIALALERHGEKQSR